MRGMQHKYFVKKSTVYNFFYIVKSRLNEIRITKNFGDKIGSLKQELHCVRIGNKEEFDHLFICRILTNLIVNTSQNTHRN